MERTLTTRAQVLTETPTTTVVVAVWNRVDITVRFLVQLDPYFSEIHRLVVVDDCSTDHTPKVLGWWKHRLEDKLVVIRHENHNRGYGPSINHGIWSAVSDIVVIMNNDIDFKGSFIHPTVEALVAEPQSLITARLVDWDSGWNRFGGEIIPYGEGWYLAAWRMLWSRLGGFDEQFVPCDYEDVDLSYRATKLDIQLKELKLPIHHLGGSSTNQFRREVVTNRNRELFAEKWGLSV